MTDRVNDETEAFPPVSVGTAGFDYPDWRGIVYPKPMPRGLHPLTCLAGYFDAVEINTSFYRPLRPDYAARWVRLVEAHPGFTFTVKLWQRFTHERDQWPGEEDIRIFKAGISPLAWSGRLGGLLIQFPWSFRNTPENRSWLEQVLESFSEYPAVLEIRHASWNTQDLYAFLQEWRTAICNIDQPLYHDSIAPADKVTSRLGYVRLHGQNYADWFRKNAGRDARYDYLYSQEELEPWVEKIKAMRRITERLYVITNNHYRGQAAVNAFQIMNLLSGKKIKVPAPLIKAYPQLNAISEGPGPGAQQKLF